MTLSKPGYPPLYILGGLLVLIVGFLVYRAVRVFLSVNNYEKYWAQRAAEPVGEHDFQIVALGDSTVQAIGATDPRKGIVGKAEQLVHAETGRNVHVFNISKSGARIDQLINEQVPRLKGLNPDLILVSIGANDAINKSDLNEYRANYKKLVETLPKNITVYANTPDVANRPDYQKIFEEVTAVSGLKVAKVYESVYPHRNDPRVYAGDFFHPSAKGYEYWFDAFEPKINLVLASEAN